MEGGFNLGPRELLTFGTVISGLAVTWGMVRQQLKAAEEKFSSMTKELTKSRRVWTRSTASRVVMPTS